MRLHAFATICLLVASTASAQQRPVEPGLPAASVPAALREVGFDQNLNHLLPLDTAFVDEYGRVVKIGDFFGERPVVLAFVYYGCPMLCLQSLSSLASTLGVMSQNPGEDFEVVSVSIDPRETPGMAREKKAHYVQRSGKPSIASGWHYLTGTEADIRRLTKAAGFRYVWDAQTEQFAHPSGIIVVTPDGRPARYLFGIEYGPRDLRLALVEASEGKIGNLADNLLLFCYHYDPMTGRYGLYVMSALRVAGVATVLMIGTFIVVMTRREKNR